MLKHMTGLTRALNTHRYRFSNVSELFSIQDREVQSRPRVFPSKNTLSLLASQSHQHEPKQQERGSEEETTEAEQDWEEEKQVLEKTVKEKLEHLSDRLHYLLQEGKFIEVEPLIDSTIESLREVPITDLDLIELFSLVRGMRFRTSNKLLLSSDTESALKSFIVDPKLSKTLSKISTSWHKYELPTLLKLPSLYRYLPSKVIVDSLNKLFSLFPGGNLGYLKHFEILNELLEIKDKIDLGTLHNTIVLNGNIIYSYFKHHYHDYELILKFMHKYDTFGGGKLVGGTAFMHLSQGIRAKRKGYTVDYDFLKQLINLNQWSFNLRSKVKTRVIDEMPDFFRDVLEKETNPSVSDLLEGFFGISSFSNINEEFGLLISEAIKQAPRDQIKALAPKISSFLRYYLNSIKPEYYLNSMELLGTKPITDITINCIRILLPICIDTFILEFLDYRLDPFMYKLIFKTKEDFAPFLDKYVYLLKNVNSDPLPVLRILANNLEQLDPQNLTLKAVIEESWKKLNKNHHKWPNCLAYYYYFTILSKHLKLSVPGLESNVKKLTTKLKTNDHIYSGKITTLWPMIRSPLQSLEYLLPVLQEHGLHQDFSKPVLHNFVQNQLKRVIRNWGVMQYHLNLKVMLTHPRSLPREFIKTMLLNLSILTMVNKQITILHPDIDTTTIQDIVLFILNNYDSYKLQEIDIKVFQMMCLADGSLFSNNVENTKKLLEILGLKEQKYIPEMSRFLERLHFEDTEGLIELINLFPPTFNNLQIDSLTAELDLKNPSGKTNHRELRKYLTVVLDKPKLRLRHELEYKDMMGKEEKILFLCSKYYESILNIEQKDQISDIETQILKMFPYKGQLAQEHLDNAEETLSVYDQFEMSRKDGVNTKYQFLKLNDVGDQRFETVELFDHPIEEEILRNLWNSPYLQNQVLPKLNDDVKYAFDKIKPWIQKMSIIAKIRGNTILMKGRERKSWPKAVTLIISKPEAFKLNLVCVYRLNKTSDTEFVVIEEQSNIENAIKNFIYKKHHMI